MSLKKVLTVCFLLAVSSSVMAELRIGVVDLRKALFMSEQAQSFGQKLQNEFADDEKKAREAEEAARKLQERLQSDGSMMNESERKELTANFQEKVREFNFLKQKLDSQVNARKQKFLEDARPQVDEALRQLQNENNLDLIIPSEAVVYADPDMDLTEGLLKKLNK